MAGAGVTQALTLRLARLDDIPALAALIPLSARGLSAAYYSARQINSAIRYVFGVDTQLIMDGTYYIAELDGQIAGCGGWSKRRTLYGGDQAKDSEDPLLDPRTEPARIRAFFVHPDSARRGIGSAILLACFDAAARAGFSRIELMSTLPGRPLYERFGFGVMERVVVTLKDGVSLPLVRMARALERVQS